MKIMWANKVKNAGFTLIESLIALGLLSFILAGVLYITEMMDHTNELLEARSSVDADLEAFTKTLQRYWDAIDWSRTTARLDGRTKIQLNRRTDEDSHEILEVALGCDNISDHIKTNYLIPYQVNLNEIPLMDPKNTAHECKNPCDMITTFPYIAFYRVSSGAGGALTKSEVYRFPRTSAHRVKNTKARSLLMTFCALEDGGDNKIEVRAEAIFVSRGDRRTKMPFRKRVKVLYLTKQRAIGEDIRIYK